jgi:ADP-ribosylglycohydrolase
MLFSDSTVRNIPASGFSGAACERRKDSNMAKSKPKKLETPTLARQLLLAVAAGDAAGIPAEFVDQSAIPSLFQKLRGTGWPLAAPGGGSFSYPANCGSDDTEMSACIVRAFEAKGHFDADATAAEFSKWLKAGPRDAGGTIRAVVGQINRGVQWFEASRQVYESNRNGAANGALMRNAVVVGMVAADNLDELMRITLLQTVITHFNPLCVLCSACHAWLLHELLAGRRPLDNPKWLQDFWAAWSGFELSHGDPVVKKWRKSVGTQAWGEARVALTKELATDFDPFTADFQGRAGYCVLTLQVCLWALKWSYLDAASHPFPVPAGFPPEVFARRGSDVIGWIPLIGNDADSYGAAAAPCLWAAHKTLPASLTTGLKVPV